MRRQSNILDDNEQKLAKWRTEQHQIASRVIIPPSPTLSKENDAKNHPSQLLSPPNNHNINLYGGVDVTFFSSSSSTTNDDDDNDDVSSAPSPPQAVPAVAVYIVMRDNEIVYSAHEFFETSVPYVSSYLSFREIDPLERLVKRQMEEYPELTPLVILVDGNGIMHVRKAGLACFLGVRTGLKTIGVGKTLYCHDGLTHEVVKGGVLRHLEQLPKYDELCCCDQNFDEEEVVMIDTYYIDGGCSSEQNKEKITSTPAAVQGDDIIRDYLRNKLPPSCLGYGIRLRGESGMVWGACLLGHGGNITGQRQRRYCQKSGGTTTGTKKPIFISVGHLVSLEEAVVISAALSRARIPEPVRMADLEGRRLMRDCVGRQCKK